MNVHDKNIAKMFAIIDVLEEYWDKLDPEQHAKVVDAHAQLSELVGPINEEVDIPDPE